MSYNRYGGYCVPDSSAHRPAARRILASDVYEPDTIEYLRANCGRGDIVHAGTYFGDFLPALSSAVDEEALVWAFEPNRENYRCARVTLELNGIGNVRLRNAGLGSRSERRPFRVRDEFGRSLGGASRLSEVEQGREPGTELVELVAIDDVVSEDRHVSLLQLDVEGHEREALIGALGLVERCRPVLVLEDFPGSGLFEGDWFASSILSLGYRRERRLHGNAVFAPETPGHAG